MPQQGSKKARRTAKPATTEVTSTSSTIHEPHIFGSEILCSTKIGCSIDSVWYRLPPDLQANIIHRCVGSVPAGYTLVCTDWHEMARREMERIEVAAGRRVHIRLHALSHFQSLKILVLHDYALNCMTAFFLRSIAQHCRLLTHLHIGNQRNDRPTQAAFKTLFLACTQLQSFKCDVPCASRMPEALCSLTALTSLSLPPVTRSGRSLPDSFQSMTQLQSLGVRETFPSRLRDVVPLDACLLRPFKSLTELEIKSCVLRHLSLLLTSLPSLQRLKLKCKQVSKFPDFSLVLALTSLHLDVQEGRDLGPCLSSLPRDLQHLVCRNAFLRQLPHQMQHCNSLQSLSLNVPNLEELPAWLGQLTGLRELMFDSAIIVPELPDSLSCLINLTTLHMKHMHRILSLPHSLCHLHGLQQLVLEDVGLLSLHALGSLTALTSIHLKGMPHLWSLPDSMGTLCNLKQLTVERCQNLVALPESLTNLQSLERVTLTSCWRLRRVPFVGAQMPALPVLQVSECAMVHVPPGA